MSLKFKDRRDPSWTLNKHVLLLLIFAKLSHKKLLCDNFATFLKNVVEIILKLRCEFFPYFGSILSECSSPIFDLHPFFTPPFSLRDRLNCARFVEFGNIAVMASRIDLGEMRTPL